MLHVYLRITRDRHWPMCRSWAHPGIGARGSRLGHVGSASRQSLRQPSSSPVSACPNPAASDWWLCPFLVSLRIRRATRGGSARAPKRETPGNTRGPLDVKSRMRARRLRRARDRVDLEREKSVTRRAKAVRMTSDRRGRRRRRACRSATRPVSGDCVGLVLWLAPSS